MDMLELRKNPRYKTLALARIPGVLEGENLLKDLSITGCCVESTVAAEIPPNTQFQIEIMPERVSHIGNFNLMVEQKWLRNDGYTTEMGFLIVASPKGKEFQRYVDYLAYRNSSVPQ